MNKLKQIKIYNINEWKESDNYTLFKWYKEKENYIKNLFDTNQMYKDLNYEKFDFDSTNLNNVKFGYVFFDDKEYDYTLEIIIDYDKIITADKDDLIDNIVITEADYNLKCKSKTNDNILTNVLSSIKDDEITKDFIINLISEIKEKNNI